MADSRTRVWFALFVLAVFCLGAAAGVFVGRRMDTADRQGRGGPMPGFGGPGGPRGGPGGGPPPQVLLERLTRDLSLDAAQRDKVRDVLEASRPRVERLQREARDGFEAEQRALHDEIRTLLTPDQQERFDRLIERGRRGNRDGRGRGQDR
jgi:uncharacterized membrane protein